MGKNPLFQATSGYRGRVVPHDIPSKVLTSSVSIGPQTWMAPTTPPRTATRLEGVGLLKKPLSLELVVYG